MKYLIKTKRHKDHEDGLPIWWRPDSRGYTTNPDKAGLYTYEEAQGYSETTHGDDIPVKEIRLSYYRKKYMDKIREKARQGFRIAFDNATPEQVKEITEQVVTEIVNG